MANTPSPKVIAQEINNVVGGKENILQIAYCMTRLRLKIGRAHV